MRAGSNTFFSTHHPKTFEKRFQYSQQFTLPENYDKKQTKISQESKYKKRWQVQRKEEKKSKKGRGLIT